MATAEFILTSGHPNDENIASFKCKLGPIMSEESFMCGPNLLHGIFGVLLNRQKDHTKAIESWIGTIFSHARRMNQEHFEKHLNVMFNFYEIKNLKFNQEVRHTEVIRVDDQWFFNEDVFYQKERETRRMKEVLSFWLESLAKEDSLEQLKEDHKKRFQAFDARTEFEELISHLESFNRDQEDAELQQAQDQAQDDD